MEIEFKILVMRILNKLSGRIDNLNEDSNKEIVSLIKNIESIKSNQSEIKEKK